MPTDADTEAGRGEGPPAREQMADHVEDIGQRLQAGDLSPEKAGGALQYLARRLRQSDPEGHSKAEEYAKRYLWEATDGLDVDEIREATPGFYEAERVVEALTTAGRWGSPGTMPVTALIVDLLAPPPVEEGDADLNRAVELLEHVSGAIGDAGQATYWLREAYQIVKREAGLRSTPQGESDVN